MHEAADTFEGDLGDLINLGTIAEVDLAAGKVRVALGDVESGWVRFAGGRAGATRSWSPPSAGEQVILLAPHGDIEQAVAIGGIASTAHPPAGDSLREVTIFADGAELAYDPEAHALEAILPAGATVRIVAPGGVTIEAGDGGVAITGDVAVTGTITATGLITSNDDVRAESISLKRHKHGGVAGGSAKTGVAE